MYYRRIIDGHLEEWASRTAHKPLLLRGARQVGKSTAVRQLSQRFRSYVEINFEKQPVYKTIFDKDLDVKRIVPLISAMSGTAIIPKETLLFLDEIQDCPNAIMALRFFKEDMPDLHVVAAGSLLEFALDDIPTFGVGRIHSLFMYPMTFDEFLLSAGEQLLLDARNACSSVAPLPEPLYEKIVQLFRIYILVGGMPEAVMRWNETHDYIQCQEVQDDILSGYESDFPKYKKKIDPVLLRNTMRSVALQATKKFVYAQVEGEYKSADIKKALDMLTKAGIIVPVTHTDTSGLPLGNDSDASYRKMLLLDTGLLLRMQNMSMGNVAEITTHILTASQTELVNKGTVCEMVAGLEILRNLPPNLRHDMYYWTRQAKNAQAEIDYLIPHDMSILPIEVKAERQGGMKSLWDYMKTKKLHEAVRCSLENFGEFDYCDEEKKETRHVRICPLFALSQLI